jgi:hypothetical protein
MTHIPGHEGLTEEETGGVSQTQAARAYDKLASEVRRDIVFRNTFRRAYDTASGAHGSEEIINAAFTESFNSADSLAAAQEVLLGVLANPNSSDADKDAARAARDAAQAGGAETSIIQKLSAMRATLNFLDDDIESNVSRLSVIDPTQAAFDFPGFAEFPDEPKGARLASVRLNGQTFTVSADTAASLAQRNFEFNNLSAGEQARVAQDILEFNNLSAFQVAQVAEQLRTGDRLDDQLAFEIEDARVGRDIQRQTVALQAAGVAAQFGGLELERRGQIVAAIGEDLAFQAQIGRVEFDEAMGNLNRIDSALNQRRAEREQLLQFAVKESSVRRDPRTGEEVTTLPGAAQLVAILGQGTGQDFAADFGELATTRIDPEGVGQNVIEASAFDSAVPALRQGLAESRASINDILGAPLGTQAVSDAVTSMAEDQVRSAGAR